MKEPEATIKQTLRHLGRSVAVFLKSAAGRKARWLIACLLLLMLAINGMNVANSYVGRYFMSAIEGRDSRGFVYFAWLYVAVFAGSTLAGVFFRFTEERLGLLWRDWLTHHITGRFIDNRIYLNMSGEDAVSNPDQRMTEDVRQLTTTTLSFLLMISNGTMAALSFSGVLWAISPKLFGVAVLYAGAGSALTIWLGRPLIRLNYRQADREADFRSELIATSTNADGIALAGKEAYIRGRLMNRIDALVENLRRIISVNRNLNFFTTGYNYMIQLIPVLIVAPLFMEGGVEFGVIGQATMAFATLLGAFSLVITQFQAISSYASVVSRLGEFAQATENLGARREIARIGISCEADHVAFRGLTLVSPAEDATVLVKNLDVRFEPGARVVVCGSNRPGRVALFTAAAGIHECGTGSIVRPPSDQVVFLPEQPYLPRCSLRELLVPARSSSPITDDQILRVLRDLGLASVTKFQEDADESREWQESLSFHDAKLMDVARAILAKPRFAFIDELGSALDEAGKQRVLDLMADNGITCVLFGGQCPSPSSRWSFLELHDDGSWTWQDA
jgi:vitamin B12/bleomycin/antimicrobial peptide transport system ATP-binding/permease protein